MRVLNLPLLLWVMLHPVVVEAATFAVDTTSDNDTLTACTAAPGDCSFRGAALRAQNAALAPGDDLIQFAIPAATDPNCNAGSGVCTITLTGAMTVAMTTATQGGLTIDGYSQPGASANTLAVPAGTNAQLRIEIAGSELTLQAPITLRGIAFGGPLTIERIGGFCCGTDPGSGRYEIEGNYFGLRADGLTPSAVPGILLHISTSSGNVDGVRIGGELPAQRNVFGSNGGATTSTECLRLTGTHHQVHGNLIGTDRSGMLALGCTTGILLQGQAIDIGGSGSAQGNLFAGHHDRAISISGTQTAGTVKAVIQGNRFGVAVDGSTPLPIGTRNVNSNDLPMIRGDNTASVVRIGGTTPAAANLFAHAGLGRPPLPSTPPYVQTAVSGLPGRWEILGNRYRGNRGAGIDTTNAGSGRRPNDVGDSDLATRSKLQNFPVISAFRRNGDAIEVDYLVDSSFAAVPGAGQSTYPLRIEFYAADGAAGAELLGVDSYPSSSAQQLRTASFSLPAGVSLAADAVIVATATDSPPVVGEPVVSATGHTSEFSFYPLESFQLLPLEPALIGVPYAVRVRAVAAPGVPFKPQGEALVIDGRGGSCTVQITPVAADRTGEGECLLTTNGAPGNINVSASYSATLNAFATGAGSSPPVSTSSQSLGSLLTVDTTSDNGGLSACTTAPADCSLRGAIIASNGLAGADTIEFNIPTSDPGCSAVTGICRIVVAADLPSVMGPVSIDGYSQPGAQPNTLPAPGANNAQLKIEITGAAGFTSFRLFSLSGTAAPFEMSGLAIFMPSNGGIVSGGLRHVIRGNWFGVTASGGIPDYTVAGSVFDLGGFNRSIVIGGPDPADRNVIAGSGRDMSTPALPGGGQNTIRVNSINSERGRILFQGNLLGLAPDGITPLPFTTALVVNPGDDVFATPDVEILDNRMARAPRNFGCTCGGNLRLSINRNMLDPTLGRTTLVQRNVFGIGVDGSFIDGTSDHVDIDLGNPSRTANIRVGGLGLDEGNVFARALPLSTFNLGSAVAIPNGSTANTQIEVVGNRMLGNAGLGVDLRGEAIPALGRTINDAGDPDTGANNRQNFPRITAYSVNGSSFDVTYLVDSSTANSAYPLRVDFYKAVGDEGEVLLDSDVYGMANAQQPKSVTLMVPPGVSLGNDDVIVAIATDAQGRSSEFSFDVVAITATDTPDPQPAGLPFTVEVTALATTGPFKPNGIVDVSLNTSPASTCSLTLAPTAMANTSRGSCQLIPVQTGNRTLTISYRTLQGAFGSASGQDVVITEPHVVTEPGPEQIGFAHCRQNVVEGDTAQIRVERPSGGVASVSVEFSHTPGNATPGDDYTVPPDQLLQWTPGDVAAKLITVPIAADGVPEPVERFRVNLGNVMGASILPFAQLDVEILDGLSDQRFANGFEGPECLP